MSFRSAWQKFKKRGGNVRNTADGNRIAEVFDTRKDGLKCVRFESGAVGVVDERGEIIWAVSGLTMG